MVLLVWSLGQVDVSRGGDKETALHTSPEIANIKKIKFHYILTVNKKKQPQVNQAYLDYIKFSKL